MQLLFVRELEDRVYVNNQHSGQKLKCDTETEIACISKSAPLSVTQYYQKVTAA